MRDQIIDLDHRQAYYGPHSDKICLEALDTSETPAELDRRYSVLAEVLAEQPRMALKGQ